MVKDNVCVHAFEPADGNELVSEGKPGIFSKIKEGGDYNHRKPLRISMIIM
jgi:hypothetical protein